MKPTKILFERVYKVAEYQNERIALEIQLDDLDDVQEAIDHARMEVFENHKRNNPHLQYYDAPPIFTNKDEPFTTTVFEDNKHRYTKVISNDSHSLGKLETPIDTSYKYPVATAEIVKKEMLSYKLGAKAFERVYATQCIGNPELEETYKNKLKELSK